MITPDDRTPEERRADLRADMENEIEALTDQEVADGLKIAITILAHNGNIRAMQSVMAAARRIKDLTQRLAQTEAPGFFT